MATLIGIVTKVIGQVFAQSADGTKRALVEGDRLFAGDQLITGAEGAVAVKLDNGLLADVSGLEPDGTAAADYRIRLDGSTVSANTAPEGEGGGVRAITTSPTQVVNATIVDNQAKLAGGLDVPVGPLEMQFATVTGNRAASEQGAGIALGRGLAAGADIAYVGSPFIATATSASRSRKWR